MENTVAVIVAVFAGLLVGFFLGRRRDGGMMMPAAADATFFTSTPGSAGFCDAKVLKFRMKGRTFHWVRHGACRPANGGYFEIRMKSGSSPLKPLAPQGVDHIFADVEDWAKPGDVYPYSLWQVLPDGREKLLHDPELEIGQVG